MNTVYTIEPSPHVNTGPALGHMPWPGTIELAVSQAKARIDWKADPNNGELNSVQKVDEEVYFYGPNTGSGGQGIGLHEMWTIVRPYGGDTVISAVQILKTDNNGLPGSYEYVQTRSSQSESHNWGVSKYTDFFYENWIEVKMDTFEYITEIQYLAYIGAIWNMRIKTYNTDTKKPKIRPLITANQTSYLLDDWPKLDMSFPPEDNTTNGKNYFQIRAILTPDSCNCYFYHIADFEGSNSPPDEYKDQVYVVDINNLPFSLKTTNFYKFIDRML